MHRICERVQLAERQCLYLEMQTSQGRLAESPVDLMCMFLDSGWNPDLKLPAGKYPRKDGIAIVHVTEHIFKNHQSCYDAHEMYI